MKEAHQKPSEENRQDAKNAKNVEWRSSDETPHLFARAAAYVLKKNAGLYERLTQRD